MFVRHFLLVSVAGWLLALGGCVNGLILHPSVNPLPMGDAKRFTTPGPDGGQPIEIFTTISPAVPAGTVAPVVVIEFPPVAERGEWQVTAAVKRWGSFPVEYYSMNYPGFGKSEGESSLPHVRDASLLAFDAIKKRAGNRPIILAGYSFGGAVALNVATQRVVSGIVLSQPAPIREVLMEYFGPMNLWMVTGPLTLQVPTAFDAMDRAQEVKIPAVFVVAQDDTYVPPYLQLKIAELYAGPKSIVRFSGGHDSYPKDADNAALGRALSNLYYAVRGMAKFSTIDHDEGEALPPKAGIAAQRTSGASAGGASPGGVPRTVAPPAAEFR